MPLTLLMSGLVGGLSSRSLAQDWIGMTPQDFANQTTSWTNTLIMNNVIENQVRDRYNKKNGVRSKGTPVTRRPARPPRYPATAIQ